MDNESYATAGSTGNRRVLRSEERDEDRTRGEGEGGPEADQGDGQEGH